MASLNLVIDNHKLETEFFNGHVRHTIFHWDIFSGRRGVEAVETWYRGRELVRGTFGTVFLERSERGEYRAVKEIVKERNSPIVIDYRRELIAMAILADSNVRDMDAPELRINLSLAELVVAPCFICGVSRVV